MIMDLRQDVAEIGRCGAVSAREFSTATKNRCKKDGIRRAIVRITICVLESYADTSTRYDIDICAPTFISEIWSKASQIWPKFSHAAKKILGISRIDRQGALKHRGCGHRDLSDLHVLLQKIFRLIVHF
jgi:hypothetical protein